MKINVNDLFFNLDYDDNEFDKQQTPLFLLHGFTGSSLDWKFIYKDLTKKVFPIAVDLIGHGNSDSPNDINYYFTESQIEQLKIIVENFTHDKIFFLGYSMGGRAALSFALKYPQMIKGLILESTSAGIKSGKEKIERATKDKDLAEFIMNQTMEEFIDHWMNLPIFDTQKRFSNKKLDEIKNQKLDNNKIGLSNSLKGFSTGVMPDYYDKLKTFLPDTLLISGELDTKFTNLNVEMASLLPNSAHMVIKNSGHNTHLEEPKEFIKAVNSYLLGF